MRTHHAMAHGESIAGVEIECEVCGGTATVKPCETDLRRTCSRECQAELMSEIHSGENHPHWDGGKVDVECEVCGETVSVWRYLEDMTSTCSTECRSEYFSGENSAQWKGGVSKYTKKFTKAKKAAVRERDDRECQHCGRSEAEHVDLYGRKHHVHHIQKARTFDDPEEANAMDNLVTLCMVDCHAAWERVSPLRPAPADD